jgi:uncharacterized protein YdbL (DUF1318 family)
MIALVDTFRAKLAGVVDEQTNGVAAHARFARKARARVADVAAAKGEKVWTTIVDGTVNSKEELAKLAGGKVVYAFPTRAAAIRFMLAYAKEHSPDPGCAINEAWFIAVDGRPWTDSIDDIPTRATIMLINFAPYARRLEEGRSSRARARKVRGTVRQAYLVAERTRQATAAAFKDLSVSKQYVSIPGGPGASLRGWPVPYITQSGERVLYPAVVIAGTP